jgi:hypothetical protein
MGEPRSVYLRRRATALGAVAAVALGAGAAVGAGGGAPHAGTPAAAGAQRAGTPATAPPRRQLPGGGRRIFPDHRVVAFYGAPQARQLGALGIGTPDAAARRLARQAAPYQRPGRPVLLAFELLATIANRDAGADGLYRTRQPDAIVRRYLEAARRHRALLVLDIQPGHAGFLDEARHLEKWLREPDVGIALDPEWHTPGAQPGTVIGTVAAAEVNDVARYVAGIVAAGDLPEKLFVVHQFTDSMVTDKPAVVAPPGLAMTFNVDGFGTRAAKLSKYRLFTRRLPRFDDGFKLFYEEDTGLMTPRRVLRMRPAPDLVVYE